MSTIDTSTWNPDPTLNESIGDIPLNANASIQQTWQAIQMLMAAGGLHGLQLVTFDGATASADGKQGLVPAPEAGDQDKFLKGDGTWDALSASDIPNIDASKITSGTIDLARLPAGALERLVTVANQTARFALTTADVQLGDTVKEEDTGLLYFVVDTSKLNSADGYEVYTAGAATSVPWSGVTGKPSSFTPSSHTHGNITNDGKLGTASRVLITDSSKKIAVSDITSTELGYLDNATSNIQNQLDEKFPLNAAYVSSGTHDLDDYKTSGMWFFSTGATLSNVPYGTNGLLLVYARSNSTLVRQIWFRTGTSEQNDHQVAFRIYGDSTWSAWKTIYTSSSSIPISNINGLQTALDSKTAGPSSSVDSHVAVFNGTDGKTLKDSGFTIGTSVPSGAVFTDTTYSAISSSYINGLFA